MNLNIKSKNVIQSCLSIIFAQSLYNNALATGSPDGLSASRSVSEQVRLWECMHVYALRHVACQRNSVRMRMLLNGRHSEWFKTLA